VTTCNICASEFHYARECREVNQGSRGRNMLGYRVGGGNRLGRQRFTGCVICGEEGHWAVACPRNVRNKSGTSVNTKSVSNSGPVFAEGDIIYSGDVSMVEDDLGGNVVGILDTGCARSVCGEK
jgi:hypothetical protein